MIRAQTRSLCTFFLYERRWKNWGRRKGLFRKRRGSQVDEIKMLISSMVEKDGRRLVRISFLRGRDYADGLLPEGVIEQAQGFYHHGI